MASSSALTRFPSDVERLLTQFADLLNHENCERLAHFLAWDNLTNPEREIFERMRVLSSQIRPDLDGRDLAAIDDSTHVNNLQHPSRKRKRDDRDVGQDQEAPMTRVKRPWASMDRLLQYLDVDTELRSFCFEHIHDPEAFFTDPLARVAEPCGRRMAMQKRKRHFGEFVSFQVDTASRLEDRERIDRVRFLFASLACYDLLMTINANSPHAHQYSGRRFGREVDILIKERVIDQLTWNGTLAEVEAGKDKFLGDFQRHCKLGVRLNVLCERLGESCLFHFAPCLTRKFIETGLRVSGSVYDRVIAALQEQWTNCDDEETGLAAYARQLRAFCRFEAQSSPDDQPTPGPRSATPSTTSFNSDYTGYDLSRSVSRETGSSDISQTDTSVPTTPDADNDSTSGQTDTTTEYEETEVEPVDTI